MSGETGQLRVHMLLLAALCCTYVASRPAYSWICCWRQALCLLAFASPLSRCLLCTCIHPIPTSCLANMPFPASPPACPVCSDLAKQRLTVRVLDADTGKADDLLGSTMRGLQDIADGQVHCLELPLRQVKGAGCGAVPHSCVRKRAPALLGQGNHLTARLLLQHFHVFVFPLGFSPPSGVVSSTRQLCTGQLPHQPSPALLLTSAGVPG